MWVETFPEYLWEESSKLSPEAIAAIQANAEKGSPEGLLKFGLLVIDGIVELSDQQRGDDHGISFALSYLKRAADEFQSPDAAYYLGVLKSNAWYLRSDGRNGTYDKIDRGTSWLKIACERKHIKAHEALGREFYNLDRYEEAAEYFERGHRFGDLKASFMLALVFSKGRGRPQNPDRARKLALYCARHGDIFGSELILKDYPAYLKDLHLIHCQAARHGNQNYARIIAMTATAKDRLPSNVAILLRAEVDKCKNVTDYGRDIGGLNERIILFLLALHRCYYLGIGGVEENRVEAERIILEEIPQFT